MPRGRKPKPTKLRLLQGNAGKRRINEREPKPAPSIPSPPEHLTEPAKQEWARVAEQLALLGLLTDLDRAAFSAYCQAYGRWVEAEEMLKKTGTVVKAPSGYPILSPYLSVANKAVEQMRAFLTEFGLTPSSRSRIAVGPGSETDDMEDFLFGSQA
jgi:P27 family predicted phage terminase small subunit